MLFLPKLCYFAQQLNNTMNKNNLKHKYISVSIILLFAFICGLNYKQWHVTNNMTTNISLLSILLLKMKLDMVISKNVCKKNSKTKGLM